MMQAGALRHLYHVEPANRKAMALSLCMHVALGVVLMMGVQWKQLPAPPVEVELWTASPMPAPEAPVVVQEQPKVEPIPEKSPVQEVAPPPEIKLPPTKTKTQTTPQPQAKPPISAPWNEALANEKKNMAASEQADSELNS
jgi:colicin import membrane protein